MRGFLLLLLTFLLLMTVTTLPVTKHASKHKTTKDPTVKQKSYSKATPVKSPLDAFQLLFELGMYRCDRPTGSEQEEQDRSSCPSDFASALQKFQTTYHLPVTKKLDNATLKLMNSPQCGLRRYSLLLTNRSTLWPKNRTLTWKLEQDHRFYDRKEKRRRIEEAFNDWAKYTDLTFREADDDEQADFDLAFVNGYHGDGKSLGDGRGGVLAHAFLPSDRHRGQIHFDSTEKWSHTYDNLGANLRLVATHQIGHSLGLNHSNDNDSIMFPFHRPIPPNKLLPLKDQISIQALYGKKSSTTATLATSTRAATTTTTTTAKKGQTNVHRHQLKANLRWKQHAKTVAGGNAQGDKLNQLRDPQAIHVDDQQQSIYIADWNNDRIVRWKVGENNGQIIAGEKGKGNRIDQLNWPTDVIVDQNSKSLIICDSGNRRVVRWSLENQQDKQIIIHNIRCGRLIMSENGDLFVSDYYKDEVKKWRKGEKEGRLVAGGNGKGGKLNQLNNPTHLFVDREETVYVSDSGNYRVMKWMNGAKEGIVVAGGQGRGDSLKQLSAPQGLIVNEVGDVYVVDFDYDRIMCWSAGSKEGRVVLGENGRGSGSNKFFWPSDLSFDVDNHLYVVDGGNNRIQRFEVDQNEK